MQTLNYREREILKLRYGLADGYTYTLEEVGKIFSVTRERVRQIESKAVRKLQQPNRSRSLAGFVDGADGIDRDAAGGIQAFDHLVGGVDRRPADGRPIVDAT